MYDLWRLENRAVEWAYPISRIDARTFHFYRWPLPIRLLFWDFFVHAAKWHSVFFFFCRGAFLGGGERKDALSYDSRSDFVLDWRTRCLLQFHDRRFSDAFL